MNKLYVILAILALTGSLTGGAYLKGRSDGGWAQKTRQLEKVRDLNERLDRKDRLIRSMETQRLVDMRQLEDRVEELREQANEDPNADTPAIGIDSVRRLNSVD